MTVEKCWQVVPPRDHVLASCYEYGTGLHDSAYLSAQLFEVARMVKHLSAMHKIEAGGGEGKFFAPSLIHVNPQFCAMSQGSDCTCTNDVAWIGF